MSPNFSCNIENTLRAFDDFKNKRTRVILSTLQKFPSSKTNVRKNALFFLSRISTHHSLIFNSRLKFTFCSKISMESLTLKRHNSFQNQNNRKSTNAFAPIPLIFNVKQKVLKFNDICVSWSSPKTGLVTNV